MSVDVSTSSTSRTAGRGAGTAAGRRAGCSGVDRTGVVRPARERARQRPGGRLTAYGPVTTTRPGARRPAPPSAARVRVRVGTALTVLALLVGLAVAGVAGVLAPGEVAVPTATTVVQVQPGDTLTGIAGQRAPGVPTDATVARIVELNGLGSAALRPGQSLTVPSGPASVR